MCIETLVDLGGYRRPRFYRREVEGNLESGQNVTDEWPNAFKLK
jgi:hypothetical protein